MRIEWFETPQHRQWGLRAVPEDYDGIRFPSELLLDHPPRLRSAERLAVAATLLFGRRAEGHLRLPRSISPLTRVAIERYLAPADLVVGPLDLAPRAIPGGVNTLHVVDAPTGHARGPHPHRDGRVIEFVAARSDAGAGVVRGVDGMTVPSNVWLFDERDTGHSSIAKLAIGVLFAEDFECGSIALDADFGEVEPALHRLLAAAGLVAETAVLR